MSETDREKLEGDESGTVLVRQMTNEQLATYHETGVMPASEDIPLVCKSTVKAIQNSVDPMPFNGHRRKT